MRQSLILLILILSWHPAIAKGVRTFNVESFSPQGSAKQVRQIMARFSAPMVAMGDPRSPQPFDIDCTDPADSRWADPRTWVLDFAHDLPSGRRCHFRLKNDLESLDGGKPSGSIAFEFDTGGPNIVNTLPEEGSLRVDERQAFLLALDGPADPKSVTDHAYCEVNGLGERIGLEILEGDAREDILRQRRALGYDYNYVLSPEDPESADRLQGEALKQAEAGLLVVRCRRSLPPDTDVRLVWGKGVRSPSGVVVLQDQTLNFRTRPAYSARLRCQRVNSQSACLPMLPLELAFTAETPSTSLMAVRLVDKQGKEYPADPIDPTKTPVVRSLTFRGPFPEKSSLRIILPSGLRDDADRPLENASRFPLPIPIDEYPPLAKFSGDFGILESNTGGILPVTLRNLEPQVAGRQRIVEVGDGVPGKIQRVDTDAEIIQWLKRVKQAGQIRGKWVTPAGSKGEDKVWKEQTGSESVFGASDMTTAITVPKPLGEREFEVVGIPLINPGFYVVELSSPKLGASLLGESKPRYVATSTLVTNLGVHFKWGRESSLVWVTTLDKATPVTNAGIQISDYCSGNVLWQGATDQDGLARISGPDILGKAHGGDACLEGLPHPLFVSARTDADLGFTSSFWNKGIQPAEFNLNVGDYIGPEIAHTVFDRSLFRAGESVSMKHFFRRHTLTGFDLPEEEAPNLVEITHSGSDQRFRIPVSLDAKGIGETAWTIPREARLGTYDVALIDDKETRHYESGSFHVEQFRLPTMKAIIQPPKDDLINPKQIPLDLFLAYINGGAASQAPVKLRTLTRPREVRFNGYDDFVFGGETLREGMDEEEAEALADEGQKPAEIIPLVLDKQGAARVTLDKLQPDGKPRDLLVEMEYQDANGEMETVSRRLPLWSAQLNIGLRTEGWIAARDEVKFDAVVLNLHGQPVIGQPVDVDIFARKTYSYRKRLIGGFYSYDNRSEVIRLPNQCQGKTDSMGRLHCEIAPGASGEILLQARTQDGDGNTVSTVTSAWLAGPEETWFDGSGTDRIDLIPEQKEYQPGETARFQVRMPFREATGWVTVEREGVAETFVTSLSGKSPTIEVPLKGTYAPNVFVSVLAVRGRVDSQQSWWSAMAEKLHLPWGPEIAPPPSALADLGKPAYRLGNAEIKVGWKSHRLDVSVEPAATAYKPRETAKVRVRVKTADGRRLPDDAELAIAAVDEALLELKPNTSWQLLDSMMNVRPIEVYTATAQMQVIGKRHFGRKAVPHGGGGGRQAARELFDTLLLWKGRIPLQGRDEMEIDIPLNDALSGFRVVAVANAGWGLFGTGSGDFRTSQPLMLNSALAPLVREGDHITASFTLRNASNAPMKVTVRPTLTSEPASVSMPQIQPSHLEIPAGGAGEALFEVEVPTGVRRLRWEILAIDTTTQAQDSLKVEQNVEPAVPVRTLQATLEQVDNTPLTLAIESPAGALPDRSGVTVVLRSRLADTMSGVTDYMRQYPYRCLEQKASVAIALRDKTRWADVVSQLPVSQDRDGLLRYFPTDSLMGSDTLTSYLLAISHETGWELPEKPRARMLDALKKFVSGRVNRESAVHAPDLTLRKLTAIEALSRYDEATPEMLDSLTIDPTSWPTSAVIDWINILQRIKNIPLLDRRQKEAEQILRTRLTYNGTTLGFSTEQQDALGWLMLSSDVNAVRIILATLDNPRWKADIPRLARGALGRQQKGRWNMTTANAWGVLAMEKFSSKFESTPVTGNTQVSLGQQSTGVTWPMTDSQEINLALPEARTSLSIQQAGTGKPWALVQIKAALPLTSPLNSGFRLNRNIQPVEQKIPGVWTRGDTARVTLEMESTSDQSWVVVDDPIPAGATILGKGLGRESEMLTRGERAHDGHAWLAYEERRQDAFRAYYQFVPKGKWSVEYTVRLNNPGHFVLPATHIEALYAPEIFADTPNSAVEVRAP